MSGLDIRCDDDDDDDRRHAPRDSFFLINQRNVFNYEIVRHFLTRLPLRWRWPSVVFFYILLIADQRGSRPDLKVQQLNQKFFLKKKRWNAVEGTVASVR